MTIRVVEEAIEQARSTIESGLTSNEIHTRYFVIDPIIRALGWDTGDPNQIRYEYPLRSEGGVDYALFNRYFQAVILIEAKDWRRDLGTHGQQLAAYLTKVHGRGQAPGLGVLTNGRQWRLYDPKRPGAFENKLIETIAIDISQGVLSDGASALNCRLRKQLWW